MGVSSRGNPFCPVSKSASGLGSGFNNPFNVYAWQIQEHKGRLVVSTFDDSSNMQLILDTLLTNRMALEERIGRAVTKILIGIYRSIVELLDVIRYQSDLICIRQQMAFILALYSSMG